MTVIHFKPNYLFSQISFWNNTSVEMIINPIVFKYQLPFQVKSPIYRKRSLNFLTSVNTTVPYFSILNIPKLFIAIKVTSCDPELWLCIFSLNDSFVLCNILIPIS